MLKDNLSFYITFIEIIKKYWKLFYKNLISNHLNNFSWLILSDFFCKSNIKHLLKTANDFNIRLSESTDPRIKCFNSNF